MRALAIIFVAAMIPGVAHTATAEARQKIVALFKSETQLRADAMTCALFLRDRDRLVDNLWVDKDWVVEIIVAMRRLREGNAGFSETELAALEKEAESARYDYDKLSDTERAALCSQPDDWSRSAFSSRTTNLPKAVVKILAGN